MICRILLAAALVTAAPFALPAQPAVAATAQSEARMIVKPHITIEVTGSGSPVILIPGLSSPRAVWDGVTPGLAAKHTVYRVQVRGFGGDDPGANLKPGILDGIIADLHALIAEEKLGAAPVIGHSMGGLAGLMLAKAHGDDVSRLMVVDALPFIGPIFVPGATVALIEPQAKAMRAQMVAGYGKPANSAVSQATAAGLALKPESRAKVAGWMDAADPRVSGQAMYEDLTTDLRPDLAAIRTPITLVYPWSAQLPAERAEAFYKGEYAGAPKVSFVPIGDAAHFVMLDQPDAFEAAVATFMGE